VLRRDGFECCDDAKGAGGMSAPIEVRLKGYAESSWFRGWYSWSCPGCGETLAHEPQRETNLPFYAKCVCGAISKITRKADATWRLGGMPIRRR
jgi:hypothetical protein